LFQRRIGVAGQSPKSREQQAQQGCFFATHHQANTQENDKKSDFRSYIALFRRCGWVSSFSPCGGVSIWPIPI
jgi:alkanesulfonate monooxygenase SsuD/methylene tetrahydromethanopterin reductase-like flavin-dependent oxidoreductase (luciferase family)